LLRETATFQLGEWLHNPNRYLSRISFLFALQNKIRFTLFRRELPPSAKHKLAGRQRAKRSVRLENP
jgi:hypothetical protein